MSGNPSSANSSLTGSSHPSGAPPPQQQQYSGQKRAAASGVSRSVNDFESEDQLRQALMSFDTTAFQDESDDPEFNQILRDIADGEPVQKVSSTTVLFIWC